MTEICSGNTRCPKKSGTLNFCYFEIWKYSIFLFYQIKHCLLKRMIPSSYLVQQYWFYNHFLKHSHLRFFLNLRELFTAGIAVHKFSSFVLFARINGHPGNNVWKSEKPLSLPETSREWREKWHWPCFEKWP